MASWVGVSPVALVADIVSSGTLVTTLLASVATLVAGVIGALSLVQARRESRGSSAPTLASSISELVTQLQTASTAVSRIEVEIRDRQALVDELGRKKEEYERLVTLNAPQVAAIFEALGAQVQASNRRAFRLNVVMSVAFFVAGIGATILTQHIFH
jgi:hypothetical protein